MSPHGLELLAALIAAAGVVAVAARRAVIEIITCLSDIRRIMYVTKAEATRTRNATATGVQQTIDTVRDLDYRVTTLTTKIQGLTQLVHHRIIDVDETIRDINERVEQCENRQEQ